MFEAGPAVAFTLPHTAGPLLLVEDAHDPCKPMLTTPHCLQGVQQWPAHTATALRAPSHGLECARPAASPLLQHHTACRATSIGRSLLAAHRHTLRAHLSLSRVDFTSIAFNGGLAPPSQRRMILLCSRLRSLAVSDSTMPYLYTGTGACTYSRPKNADLPAAHAATVTSQSHTLGRCMHTSGRQVQLGQIMQPVPATCCSKAAPLQPTCRALLAGQASGTTEEAPSGPSTPPAACQHSLVLVCRRPCSMGLCC